MKELKKLRVVAFLFFVICVCVECSPKCDSGNAKDCPCNDVKTRLVREINEDKHEVVDQTNIMKLAKRTVRESAHNKAKADNKTKAGHKSKKGHKGQSNSKSPKQSAQTKSNNATAAQGGHVNVKVLNPPKPRKSNTTSTKSRRFADASNSTNNTLTQSSNLTSTLTKTSPEDAGATNSSNAANNLQQPAPVLSDKPTQKVVKRDVSVFNVTQERRLNATLNVTQERTLSVPSLNSSSPLEKVATNTSQKVVKRDVSTVNGTEDKSLNLGSSNITERNRTQERTLNVGFSNVTKMNSTQERTLNVGFSNGTERNVTAKHLIVTPVNHTAKEVPEEQPASVNQTTEGRSLNLTSTKITDREYAHVSKRQVRNQSVTDTTKREDQNSTLSIKENIKRETQNTTSDQSLYQALNNSKILKREIQNATFDQDLNQEFNLTEKVNVPKREVQNKTDDGLNQAPNVAQGLNQEFNLTENILKISKREVQNKSEEGLNQTSKLTENISKFSKRDAENRTLGQGLNQEFNLTENISKVSKREVENKTLDRGLNQGFNLTENLSKILKREVQNKSDEGLNQASNLTENISKVSKREVENKTLDRGLNQEFNLTENLSKISKREVQNKSDEGLNQASNLTENISKVSKREVENKTLGQGLNQEFNLTENISKISQRKVQNKSDEGINQASNLTENISKVSKREAENKTLGQNLNQEFNYTIVKREVQNKCYEGLNQALDPTENISKREIQNTTLGQGLNQEFNITENISKISKREVQNKFEEGLNQALNVTGNISELPKRESEINPSVQSLNQSSNITAHISKREVENIPDQGVNQVSNLTENISKITKREVQKTTTDQSLNQASNISEIAKRLAQNTTSSQRLNETQNLHKRENANFPSEQDLNQATNISESIHITKREVQNNNLDPGLNQAANMTEVVSKISKRETQINVPYEQGLPSASNNTENRQKGDRALRQLQTQPLNVLQAKPNQEVRKHVTFDNHTEVIEIPDHTIQNLSAVAGTRGIILERPEHVSQNGSSVPLITSHQMIHIGSPEQEAPENPLVELREDAQRKVKRYIGDLPTNTIQPTYSLNNLGKSPANGMEEHKCCNKSSSTDTQNVNVLVSTNQENCTKNCSGEPSSNTNLTIIFIRSKRDVTEAPKPKPKPKPKRKNPTLKTPRNGKQQRRRRKKNKAFPSHAAKREVENDDAHTFPKHIVELRETNFTIYNTSDPNGDAINAKPTVSAVSDDAKIIQKRSDSLKAVEKKSDPEKSGERTKRSIVNYLPDGNKLENQKLIQVSVIKRTNDSGETREIYSSSDSSTRLRKLGSNSPELDFESTENATSDDMPTLIKIDVDNKTKETGHLPKFFQSDEKDGEGYQQVLDNLKKGFMAVGCGCPIYYDRFVGQKLPGPVIQGTLVSVPKGAPDFVKEIMCSTACCQMNSMYSKAQREIICHGLREWEKTEKSIVVPHPTELWEADHVVMCSFLSENDEATVEYLLSWLRIIIIYIVGILLILVLICLYLTCFLRPYKKLHHSKKMDMVRLVVNKKCDSKPQGYLIAPKV